MIDTVKITDRVESITIHLLDMLGVQATNIGCQAKEITDNHGNLRTYIRVDLTMKDSARLLIGARGSHLTAFQHLVRCLASRQCNPVPLITVDVNNYITMREEATLNVAEQAARKAGRTRHAVVLPPMSAAQRHTVHTSLASRSDIQTESLGQEPNRRIVIRPVF